MRLLFFSCLVLFAAVQVVAAGDVPKDDDSLNIHIVCHTHDDVGWLKTVDQYYAGLNTSIQRAGVQNILNSVIPALQRNPERKFIYVEMAFFWRWWKQQNEETHDIVRKLVQNKQLEFINGGWCMNDEAGTHYVDVIDQMALGHEFLAKEFGVAPTIGWHIDPFGHSSTHASLFSMMGFNGFFLGRIDYQDKQNRLTNKQLEMIWRSSPALGKNADIFTGILYDLYVPPPGFCFDINCGDTAIQDDPELEDYNVDVRAQQFVEMSKQRAQAFKTKNVLHTMGMDFEYEAAELWFTNLDKLVKYIRANPDKFPGVNVMYSTPSLYLDYVNAANETWDVKTDDFMPYADGPHQFWTGYFTSRPALKGYVRHLSNYLQACTQLEFLGEHLAGKRLSKDSMLLRRAMGVAQHHDAVAGTERQHVAFDYAKRLSRGHASCETVMNEAVGALSAKGATDLPEFSQCDRLNVSICAATSSGKPLAMLFYNPLAHSRTEFVRLPVNSTNVVVMDKDAQPVKAQIDPNFGLRRAESSDYTLIFEVTVPALGYSTYYMSESSESDAAETTIVTKPEAVTSAVSLDNGVVRADFSAETHRLSKLSVLSKGIHLPVEQDMQYYLSNKGDSLSGEASGAYVFRPITNSTTVPMSSNGLTISLVKGPLVSEIRIAYNMSTKGTEVFRLYNDAAHLEVEYTVGPIDISDGVGKEVITKFSTPMKSEKTCYTDSNGREMQKRVRDFRPTWNLVQTEEAAGNYYPINTAAYIECSMSKNQLFILTDRSQGGGSIADGELEVMLHRRLTADDNKGVGEDLSEPGLNGKGLIVRTKHYVFVDSQDTASIKHRVLSDRLNNPVIPLFAESDMKEWADTHAATFSAVEEDLPLNVRLVTLRRVEHKQVLLRLAHVFGADESAKYSMPVTVDLKTVLPGMEIRSVTEMSLTANQKLSDVRKMSWNTNSEDDSAAAPTPAEDHDTSVTLNPMDIRTFLVAIA